MVDEVVVGEGHEPGLDFKDHFLRIRPQLLVVTEDDKYADVKRQLCAEVGAWASSFNKGLGCAAQGWQHRKEAARGQLYAVVAACSCL
jgi:hypothetical protein